jgi:hypothetical protein
MSDVKSMKSLPQQTRNVRPPVYQNILSLNRLWLNENSALSLISEKTNIEEIRKKIVSMTILMQVNEVFGLVPTGKSSIGVRACFDYTEYHKRYLGAWIDDFRSEEYMRSEYD